ncbi:PhnD/SsuA/transferrin family substrate-binding protein [Eikenella sp. S3360]|uniref:PhnD/SsuA/transferrin family substrate-binding protein n=1 Tax=Eikenella glucosivorans TaxID=2766967 RepID=A0ABS0NC13_9NEIS|nr:PhnD/SsuA/transferrin family substrate-binding protein [Eikenella glucosivorans]MBH5329842.1 PhnD/SsuA/transferrin family substrate-binding protein [Eikenella glucosivorans]
MVQQAGIDFVVAPDYLPDHFSNWYLLSSYLQRETELLIHLQLPSAAAEIQELAEAGKMAMLYANAFDAVALMKDKGYLPLARLKDKFDEAVVAVSAESEYQKLADLPADALVKTGPNPDIHCLGLRLLKEAGLDADKLKIEETATFSQAASALIKGGAQVGFFVADTYAHMSKRTLEQLRVLQESKFEAVTHMVVLHPDFAEQQETLQQAFVDMAGKPAGQAALESLDLPAGFAALTQEEAEQMVAAAEGGKQDD